MENTVNAQNGVKTNWWNVLKIGMLFVSWCLGSSFVSGQESLQYFVGFGIWGYATIFLAMSLHIFLCYSFFSLGFEKKFNNPMEIFEYYTGHKILAKIFQVFSLGLLASAPIVMISAFGAAMQQHWGISNVFGSMLIGALCLLTILLGLRKVVDVVGVSGPILVSIAIGTGIFYLINNFGSLSHGIEIAAELPLNRIAPV